MTNHWTRCETLGFLTGLGAIATSFFCVLVFVRLSVVVYCQEPWRNALKYRITDILLIIALAAALWVGNAASTHVEAYVCSQPEITSGMGR
mgnify:FL=1